ncbi:hypothetical protein HDU96_000501 [Phlyctochytrium bullatum]|nr:hypothetical protein HDU96_000501 [Phlyctochytrium bullatum]
MGRKPHDRRRRPSDGTSAAASDVPVGSPEPQSPSPLEKQLKEEERKDRGASPGWTQSPPGLGLWYEDGGREALRGGALVGHATAAPLDCGTGTPSVAKDFGESGWRSSFDPKTSSTAASARDTTQLQDLLLTAAADPFHSSHPVPTPTVAAGWPTHPRETTGGTAAATSAPSLRPRATSLPDPVTAAASHRRFQQVTEVLRKNAEQAVVSLQPPSAPQVPAQLQQNTQQQQQQQQLRFGGIPAVPTPARPEGAEGMGVRPGGWGGSALFSPQSIWGMGGGGGGRAVTECNWVDDIENDLTLVAYDLSKSNKFLDAVEREALRRQRSQTFPMDNMPARQSLSSHNDGQHSMQGVQTGTYGGFGQHQQFQQVSDRGAAMSFHPFQLNAAPPGTLPAGAGVPVDRLPCNPGAVVMGAGATASGAARDVWGLRAGGGVGGMATPTEEPMHPHRLLSPTASARDGGNLQSCSTSTLFPGPMGSNAFPTVMSTPTPFSVAAAQVSPSRPKSGRNSERINFPSAPYKTVICRTFMSSGRCFRSNPETCWFAHGAHELRGGGGSGHFGLGGKSKGKMGQTPFGAYQMGQQGQHGQQQLLHPQAPSPSSMDLGSSTAITAGENLTSSQAGAGGTTSPNVQLLYRGRRQTRPDAPQTGGLAPTSLTIDTYNTFGYQTLQEVRADPASAGTLFMPPTPPPNRGDTHVLLKHPDESMLAANRVMATPVATGFGHGVDAVTPVTPTDAKTATLQALQQHISVDAVTPVTPTDAKTATLQALQQHISASLAMEVGYEAREARRVSNGAAVPITPLSPEERTAMDPSANSGSVVGTASRSASASSATSTRSVGPSPHAPPTSQASRQGQNPYAPPFEPILAAEATETVLASMCASLDLGGGAPAVAAVQPDQGGTSSPPQESSPVVCWESEATSGPQLVPAAFAAGGAPIPSAAESAKVVTPEEVAGLNRSAWSNPWEGSIGMSFSDAGVRRIGDPRVYKTEICKFYDLTGACKFGSGCTFAHGMEDLRGKPKPLEQL